MQPLVAPRRMKYVPPERDLLYKDHKDVSERTVYILRAWSPDRKRFVPLAAPRQVDTIRSRVGNTHRRAGALTSPPLSSTPSRRSTSCKSFTPCVVVLMAIRLS